MSAKDYSTRVPTALPSLRARIVAVGAVLLAGGCGAIIGRSLVTSQCSTPCQGWEGIGLVLGALTAAGGVAIVAVLALRAIDEWDSKPRELSPDETAARLQRLDDE